MNIKFASPLKTEKTASIVSEFSKQKGFTLLNTLSSLMVYMFIAGTAVSMFHLFLSPAVNEDDIRPEEWTITAEQMLKECKEAEDIKVKNNGRVLELKNSLGDAVRYEPYRTLIRKRVNSKGHMPMLQHVKHVKFRLEDHHVIFDVIGLNGKKYRAAFPIYHSG
ncbi:competence type IV pilus minor pilin ComGF [Bacillus sonorensis]|uniref:competence type IV pilus minor pilin ComGF n=1 Tax=Bacillus sonorensis TaxID=119858 RepID=UPI002280380C|nr:competence type IV pilus minor pilin ComGF [Bacillus sonorensis]MCY8404949.1 ComGF family competence protein [Bacillus sonorensis]MEC1438770.1 competence type IV pilus minor pilin ComGF [Bacillus sonorensis]